MWNRQEKAIYPLCISRLRASFPVMEAMKGQHIYRIRAKVHEAILTQCPVAIEPDDLLCGIGSSKPFGIEMDYELGRWTPDEIESLKAERYSIEPEEEEELYHYMERYASGEIGRARADVEGEMLGNDPVFWPFMKTGVVLPKYKDKKVGAGGGRAMSGAGLNPIGLYVPDYEVILNRGMRDVINECKQHIADLKYVDFNSMEKKLFWEGCITCLEAAIVWANRYGDEAEKEAERTDDPKRKAELLEMARICHKVPENKPDTFREALQSFWFLFLLMNPSPTCGFGRFDQYMYPYYKKDKEAGLITDDEVLELLEIIRLKDMQLGNVAGKENRKRNAGMAKWHNMVIGGVDPVTGEDATNELSYLVLQAAMEVRTPHHTVSVRVHKNSPMEFLKKATELVRMGSGMPAFVGDESYINFFLSRGVALERARNYSLAGCVDGYIAGETRGEMAAMFVVTLVYDIFMHNGYCPTSGYNVGLKTGEVTEFKTFDEYLAAFYKQLEYFVSLANQFFNIQMSTTCDMYVDFLRSVLTKGCLQEGIHAVKIKHKPFDALTVCSAVGVVNVANSLAAVKKLVYEEKKYTMAELKAALDANWEGYDQIRQDCLDAPKFGNNDDYVDLLAADVYSHYADYLSAQKTMCDGYGVPNAISITAHQPGGAQCTATPDGRYSGQILADASMSPAQGTDKNGPTAAFQSAMKVNQDKYQATLMNMKFSPSALKTDGDLEKLASMIKTYLTNGGKHIQFNVVDRATLLDAKVAPEKHKDLIVRIAGYSAYFTQLTNQVQEDVITRTEHNL